MARLQTISGGVLGAGGTVALRQTMDTQDGQPNNFLGEPNSIQGRLSRPSVIYGLGGGLLSGALVYADRERYIDTPDMLDGVFEGLMYSGIPAGVASAVFPAEASQESSTSTQAVQQRISKSEFQDAGGEMKEEKGGTSDTSDMYAPAE